MRNKYKGRCWVCGETVEVGEGYFTKSGGKWITKHATGTIQEIMKCKASVAYKKNEESNLHSLQRREVN